MSRKVYIRYGVLFFFFLALNKEKTSDNIKQKKMNFLKNKYLIGNHILSKSGRIKNVDHCLKYMDTVK